MRMLVKPRFSLHRVALFVALTLALVATGFAHRMPLVQDEAVAYALANGVPLADLCGSDPGEDGFHAPPCAACQISGSADLVPASGLLIRLELAFHARIIASRESRAVAAVLDPAHTPQGPPVA